MYMNVYAILYNINTLIFNYEYKPHTAHLDDVFYYKYNIIFYDKRLACELDTQ